MCKSDRFEQDFITLTKRLCISAVFIFGIFHHAFGDNMIGNGFFVELLPIHINEVTLISCCLFPLLSQIRFSSGLKNI